MATTRTTALEDLRDLQINGTRFGSNRNEKQVGAALEFLG
jgi:hypothetical protein